MPLLRALASLRLTVALLAAAMVLIFIGTIAQTRLGVWQAVDQYFRAPIAWVDVAMLVGEAPGRFRIPIPGGLTIAALLTLNLIAAHTIRFKATRRRIGIIMLHLGLIVLLLGEFVTGFLATEGLMSIDEGAQSSYIEDIRGAELAVVDPSDPETDRIITVPGSVIAAAASGDGVISDPRLPFDIVVDSWMPNAALVRAEGETPADRGVGLDARAIPQPRVSGVEGGRTDTPAAYITLRRGDTRLGTWLVSADLREPQRIELGEAAYGLALRFRRTYLPYTLHLKDFRHDVFTGTTIPRNFSSDVRLIDPSRGVDRDVRIWMNNPLRYQGRTFYQASYKPDGSGTVLQVVRNPGWLLPYAACILVGVGMTVHFVQSLTGFLRRRQKRATKTADVAAAPPRRRLWVGVVTLAGIVLAASALLRPQPESMPGLDTFARLPVSAGGRIKPIDTAARSMLMIAGGRQSAKGTPATSYLLDLITRPTEITDLAVVRVDQPEVLALLDRAPDAGGRLPLTVIQPKWRDIAEAAAAASAVAPRERDAFQGAVLDLHSRVNTMLAHAQMREPYVIPPASPTGSWRPFFEAFRDDAASPDANPAIGYYATMMTAASEGDSARFARAAAAYEALLRESMPGIMRRMDLEVLFNRASLFSGTAAVYLLAGLGALASFILRGRADGSRTAETIRAGSAALLLGAVVVHTVAIAVRIYLQDRPPVTNLYSSAVFVGWAAAVAALFIERLFPIGVAVLGASIVGCGTLIVAHNLGNDGDTMQMMQAVLDSNFWLATHVITITLGYSATFLAGVLAAAYLVARSATGWITRPRAEAMGKMIYGSVCFALLVSFVGTVLGGIWADQSWGRFWGWDPKENGAALVVLINAIILHARWGGLVKLRGIAVLAVLGNIVTAWSWFGTNMLGVGLHAYGFMDGAMMWLSAFIALQLAVMSLGLIKPAAP